MVTAKSEQHLRKLLAARPDDLLALRLDDLGADTATDRKHWMELDDAPAILLVADEENAEQRSALLAAGVLGIAYTGLSEDSFDGLIRTFGERRPEKTEAKLQSVPHDDYALADYATSSLANAALPRVGAARRNAGHDGVTARRNGHRQGSARARAAQRGSASRSSLHLAQLRSAQ